MICVTRHPSASNTRDNPCPAVRAVRLCRLLASAPRLSAVVAWRARWIGGGLADRHRSTPRVESSPPPPAPTVFVATAAHVTQRVIPIY